jgi:hypothetical protein
MSAKAKAYRESKIAELGATEYKRQEAEKRKKRRDAKTTKPSMLGSMESFVDQIYKRKIAFLADKAQPITVKRETVSANITRIYNLYKRLEDTEEEPPNLTFLNDTGRVIKFITKNYGTPQSRVSQINSITSILSVMDSFTKEYEIYTKFSKVAVDKINDESKDNLLSKKEADNILPWVALKVLHEKVNNLRERAIVAIYTLLPPRRIEDIALLTLDGGDDVGALKNSIVIKDGFPVSLIYRKYKTDKTYGETKINIPYELQLILIDYIQAEGLEIGNPLFETATGGYYMNFSEFVGKVFKKYTSKNISVNLLRHSFISNFLKVKRSQREKEIVGQQMGHSVGTQSKYDRVDL